MSAGSAKTADLRTGAIIVLSIAAFVGALLGSTELFSPESFHVHVKFPFWAGVEGICPGSPVNLGGLHVGHVDSLSLPGAGSPDASFVDANLSFLPGIRVPRNATVSVSRPITGGIASLTIELPRDTAGQHAQSGDTLVVSPEHSPLALVLGAERAQKFEEVYASLASPEFAERFLEVRERFATLSGQASEAARGVREDWAVWEPQLNGLLAAREASERRLDEIRGLFAAGKPLDAARLETTIAMLRENWASADELFETLKTRMGLQAAPRLGDLFDRIGRSVAVMKNDAARIQAILRESVDASQSASADLSIAGDQIGRLMREVTLMPWTLLGGGFENKGERAQFLKFAREIVRSAAELHLAVLMAQSLLESDPQLGHKHPELVALLNSWIEKASAEHEVAGTMLLNQLIGPPAP
ncbi:MAG: hypothetical protein EXS03_05435 [Phycisphaerales bacterium]|nr:hypothetical protein [Phycisphaerales bacterium]